MDDRRWPDRAAPYPKFTADHRSGAVVGEEFQQNRLGTRPSTMVQARTPFRTAWRAVSVLGIMPPAIAPSAISARDLVGVQLGLHRAGRILDPGDIGQQQQPVGAQRAGHRAGHGVAIDVERLAAIAGPQRRDDRDHPAGKKPGQHMGVDPGGPPDKAQLGRVGHAGDQRGVLARQADGAAALAVDRLHDTLVDGARQHHLDNLDRGGVGDPLAVPILAFDAQPGEHGVDHRPAAMDDHRVDPDLTHQHHIAGEAGQPVGIAHGVPTELDDDGAPE
mgnify:CR=1 FL=1